MPHHRDGTAAGAAGRPATLVDAFLDRVEATPTHVAYARKRLGLWEETTWSEYAAEVGRAVTVLEGMGLRPGDVVALLGDARPELSGLVLAGQLLGLRCAPLYPSIDPSELAGLLTLLEPRLVVGEDDEDVLKLGLAGIEVEHVVVLEPRGGALAGARPWADLLGPVDGPPPDLRARAAGVGPDDAAYLALTSGAAESARPVVVAHRNVLAGWSGACALLPAIDHRDRIVVDAPLAHPAGQAGGLVLPVVTGCVPFFVEDPRQALVAAVEVRPTVALGTPRRWLRLWRQVRAGVEESSRLKRGLFTAATGLRSPRAARLVHLPLLRKVGASRLRVCVVGWAALPQGLTDFWSGVGLEVRELYGLAEAAGVVTVTDGPPAEPGVLGTPVAGADLELAPDGEVLVRGPQVCQHYLGEGGEPVPATDAEGWLHTHDVARPEGDGSLALAGRREGLLVLGDGSTVHAEAVERALRASTYVAEAITFVGAMSQVGAVVELDLGSVAAWARARGVAFTATDELPGREEVRRLVDEELQRANAGLRQRGLPSVTHVDVAPVPLGLSELTPTRRVRGSHRRSLAEAGWGAGLATD